MLPILQNNSSRQKIYNEWVKKSHQYFSKCKDEDFFSNKMHHIYFYCEVNDENVNRLNYELQEASKTKIINGVQETPKPICLHLNSGGGSVASENLFDVMIKMQRVPFCVITENNTCSAATMISLVAPYRLMIEHSMYLIHDMAGGSYEKSSNVIHSNHKYLQQWLTTYIPLLKERTKLTDEEINMFIKRDIYLDDKYCKRKGIIDRILKIPKVNTPNKYNDKNKYSNVHLSLSNLLKKTNLNHMYIDANNIKTESLSFTQDNISSISEARSLNDLCIILDKLFINDIKNINKKQLILHFLPYESEYSNPLDIMSLTYRIALLQKQIPVIAFIEGFQSLGQLGLILMCPIRIMITPSIISSYYTFSSYTSLSGSSAWAWKTIDVIKNTQFMMKQIKSFLKKHSDLPNIFYIELDKEIITLKPEDLLRYNIIHLSLQHNKKHLTTTDIVKYLNLNKMTAIYKNNKGTSRLNLSKSKTKSKRK